MDSQLFATLFYTNFINVKKIKNPPSFFYTLGNTQNDGFVMTPNQTQPTYFSNDRDLDYEYILRIYMPKTNHQNQINIFYKLLEFITKDLFDLNFEDYKIVLTTINGLKNPLKEWIIPEIETYSATHQGYSLNIKFTLRLKEI